MPSISPSTSAWLVASHAMKVALSPGDSEEINKSDVTRKKPSRIKRF